MSAGFYRRHGKRALDLGLGGLLLIVQLPLLALLAGLVALRLGRPVLFRQPRIGRGGRAFELLKLRTMRDLRDEHGRPLPDDRRLTRLGRLLRRLSLDELPSLWHVVSGEMSLVGPRPLLVPYLERYTPEQARRHEIRPGLTGWAQIHGRNAVEWRRRFALDVWYVDHHGLWLDLKILLLTLAYVVRGHGIHAPGHVTMPEFEGSEGE